MKSRRLGDLCITQSGGTPRRENQDFYGGSIPWAKIGDITAANGLVRQTEEHLTRAGLDAIGGRLFPSGTLLLAMYGSVGKVAVAGCELSTNQAILGIQARDESKVNLRFLRWWFEYIQPRLAKAARGVTQANISKTIVDDLVVPEFTLAEQHNLSVVLDKADAICRKRQEAIALTEQLLRSTFMEMFGHPVSNPKRWPETLLGETFLVSPQIGTTKPAHDDGEYSVVRVGELGKRDVAINRCGRITLPEKDFKKFLCHTGDILLARAIGSEDQLGKASIVGDSLLPIVFDSHVMRLRFDPSRVRTSFFYHWLGSDGGRSRFMRRAGRTAVQFNVNAEQISGVVLPLPPLEEQDRWCRFEQQSLPFLRNLRAAEVESRNLFNSLVQRAFTGQL